MTLALMPGGPALVAAFLGALLAPGPAGGTPTFVESRINVGAEDFEYQFFDQDGDGRSDLAVSHAVNGERILALHRLRADASFPPTPDWRLTVPPDVVSFSLLDLRPEPGREVVLLTRGGVFSLSPAKEGLQGNLRRELALPLFPDVPDPERLPSWRLVQDVDGDGRAELLVVSDDQLVALKTADVPGATPSLVPVVLGRGELAGADDESSLSFGGGGLDVRSRRGVTQIFPGARSSRPSFTAERLLSRSREIALPALLDWNGDRRLDRVLLDGQACTIALQGADGRFGDATRVPLPQSAAEPTAGAKEGQDTGPRAGRTRQSGRGPRVRLDDCDGDGRAELVIFRSSGDGLGKAVVALVFPRDADGRPAETPSARIEITAMDVDYQLVDIDHDGRRDLLATTLDIPTGLSTLATVRLDAALHVFRGGDGATFRREPAFQLKRTFRPEQLGRVRESLLTKFTGDFDGDGVNDLVVTELDGRVEIHRVQRNGERLERDRAPLASFLPPAPIESMETWDLSNDGVADLMLRHAESLTLFVSRKAGGP